MKPAPKPQSTILCSGCKRLHQLFWKVSGPNKRDLVYLCDRVQIQQEVCGKANKEFRTVKRILLAPEGIVPADNLPEKLSRTWKKILEEQNQPRFAL